MLKTILFSLLLLPVVAFAQDADDTTGSDVSNIAAQELLNHHNKARAEVGVGPLKWSSKVATHAQEWADAMAAANCKFEHRPNNAYGENIFLISGSPTFNPVAASLAWYGEKAKYTYAKIGQGTDWDKVLHYTQMIWKQTTELGVGMATCANGNIIVVANYNQRGNMSGEYPY